MTKQTHFQLDHIQITTARDDEIATIAFYADIVGLARIEKPDALKSRGGAWFQLDGWQLHVGVENKKQPSTKQHIALRVPNLDDFEKLLVQANHDVTNDPILVDGRRRLFVLDPAGNRLEFIDLG